MKRKPIPQADMNFAGEPFALVAETARDWARVQEVAQKRERDRIEAGKAQELFAAMRGELEAKRRTFVKSSIKEIVFNPHGRKLTRTI